MVKIERKYLLLGIIATVLYSIPWIILYILHISEADYEFTTYDVDFIVDIIFSASCMGTVIHLMSYTKKMEGNYKKLYQFSSLTFSIIFFLWLYHLIDLQMRWMEGIPGLFELENELFPYIYYELFNIPGFMVIISFNSALGFMIFMLAISFYLYPMERHVTQLHDKPWHTYSNLICVIIIPIVLSLRNVPNFGIIISIVSIVIQILTLYNSFYLVYIYMITGIKAPKKTSIRRACFCVSGGIILIGLFFLFRIGFFTMLPSFMESSLSQGVSMVDVFMRILLGLSGNFLFNLGYYLIDFDLEKKEIKKKNP